MLDLSFKLLVLVTMASIAGCSNVDAINTNLKNVTSSSEEAGIFDQIASSFSSYEISFFDLHEKKVIYSDESISTIKTIEIRFPNRQSIQHEVFDQSNLWRLMLE